MTHAQTLIRFCKKIGIADASVREAETLEGYHLVRDVTAGDLKRLSPANLMSLTDAFGEALSLRIGIPDGPPLLEIEKGAAKIDLDAALQLIEQRSDALELRFDLSLEKTTILRDYHLLGNRRHALCYLFKEKLLEFLKSPLPELDGRLFAAPDRPTVILLSDTGVHYTGQFLTIVGEAEIEQARQAPSSIHPHLQSRIDKYHKNAFESLSWSGFRLLNLTPLHFLCQRADGDADEIESILADRLLHLCILYTANRSSYDNGRFQAYYAGSEKTITLALQAAVSVPEGQTLLPRLALWPYGGRETDRLTIFQNVVARELEGNDPDENYRSFVRQLRHLLAEARWHHRVFVDGQINKHFEQAQKVADYVAEVAKGVSQALEAVTKSLTDTLLATVGVIVLTLLASLIKNETQDIIFRIGMWAYAVYLLLFQGFYRMGSIVHGYILLKRETDERLATYAQGLGKSKVDALSSPLVRRKRQFLFWFWLTVAVYLGVIGLILALGYCLPPYLIELGIVVQTATPEPMLSPMATPRS